MRPGTGVALGGPGTGFGPREGPVRPRTEGHDRVRPAPALLRTSGELLRLSMREPPRPSSAKRGAAAPPQGYSENGMHDTGTRRRASVHSTAPSGSNRRCFYIKSGFQLTAHKETGPLQLRPPPRWPAGPEHTARTAEEGMFDFT